MLFLLLGEVHPLIFHQVPTSQMSNNFSTWSWNIHTHNTHLPIGLWKATSRWWFEPIWENMLVKTGQLPKLGWIIWRYQIFLNPHQQKWLLQLSFHQSSGSYHGNPPKNHSFCQQKRNRQPPGGLRKGSFKHGPPSFIGGVHPPFSSSPQVATCLLLALLEQNTCGESGEMWWVVVGWWLVLKL